MKAYRIILAASSLLFITSCQPKLTTQEANALSGIAPSAIDATVQKIGGAPVDLNSAPIDLTPFSKLPAIFAQAYSPAAVNVLAKTKAFTTLNSSFNATLQNLRSGRAQLQAAAPTGCGNDIFPPDTDADGIPDSVVDYQYNCLSGDNQFTGSITIKDNDLNGVGPYEVHVKNFKALNINSQSTDYYVSITLNLDLNLKSNTSPYAVSQSMSLTLKPDDSGTDFITVGFTSDSKYTPDNLQNPFNGAGMLDLNSSFNFAFKLTDPDTNEVVQTSKTFKLLARVHRDKTCVGDVEMNNGNIEFSDNAGGFVKTTFASCNSKNWKWTNNAK